MSQNIWRFNSISVKLTVNLLKYQIPCFFAVVVSSGLEIKQVIC